MPSYEGQCPVCYAFVTLSLKCGLFVIGYHVDERGRECEGIGEKPRQFVEAKPKPPDLNDSGGFGGGFGNE